jgi:hypothetical protein
MPVDAAIERLKQEIPERRVRMTYSGSEGLEGKATGKGVDVPKASFPQHFLRRTTCQSQTKQ